MTTRKIKKAMLLAAGFGTRLRPITETTPKPCLPLNDELIIDHQLKFLAKNGIAEVMINLHHLGWMIKEHVGDGSVYGLAVHYSEEHAILGTGGGIKKVLPFFDGKPFVALNSKAIIDANIPKIVGHHRSSSALATLVLTVRPPGDEHTAISINEQGFIVGFGSGGYIYTGLQIIDPEALDALPPPGTYSCLIRDCYTKLLERNAKIASFIHHGYFLPIETKESYDRARHEYSKQLENFDPARNRAGQ